MRSGRRCARRRPAPRPAAGTPPPSPRPAKAPGGCRSRAWSASSRRRAATYSTGCASTAAARASAAVCPKRTTPTHLITAAHHQLQAPLIVVWDNLNTHVSAVMHEFTGAHPNWLTVIQLPSYAPDLNPCEGVWSTMKNGLGNLAACTADQLAAIVRNRLKRIQYRPVFINGFLAQTGLSLEPEPP
jgi:hypothetical protein